MGAFVGVSTGFPYRTLVSGETVTRSVTAKAGEGLLKRGQIMGKEAATGKYMKASAPASAIVAEDVDATAADVLAAVYVQGRFKANTVILPPATTLAQAREQLWDFGIYLETVEETTGLIVRSIEAPDEQFLKAKEEEEPEKPPIGGALQGTVLATGPILVGEEIAMRAAEGYKPLLEPLEGDAEKARIKVEEAAEKARQEQQEGGTQ